MPQLETMTEDQMQTAVDVLHRLGEAFSDLPDERGMATPAAICCTVAASYVVELLAHLAEGIPINDAIQETVRGNLLIGNNE